MTILQITATPRHRTQYPGELRIMLGSRPGGGETATWPGRLSIALQHAPDYTTGAYTAAAAEGCELIARNGAPVLLIAGEPAVDGSVDVTDLASLAGFTGEHLARELLDHMDALLSQFRPGNTWLEQWVRFRDPARFNDLICNLAARHLGTARGQVLRALLADVDRACEPQMAWYRASGPTARGETRGGYQAEAAAFVSLTDTYLAGIRTQLAAEPRLAAGAAGRHSEGTRSA